MDNIVKKVCKELGLTYKELGKPRIIKDLGILQKGKLRRRFYLIECPYCKKHFETQADNYKAGKVTKCRSCATKLKNFKHGDSKSRLFKIWIGMLKRCTDKKSKSYQYYGGRGITVCDEWKNDYKNFKNWALSNGYNDNLTIDRIDNSKGYSPENCRWVTMDVQFRNKSKKGIGVTFHKRDKKYQAYIKINDKQKHLGYFNTFEEALNARKEFERKLNKTSL